MSAQDDALYAALAAASAHIANLPRTTETAAAIATLDSCLSARASAVDGRLQQSLAYAAALAERRAAMAPVHEIDQRLASMESEGADEFATPAPATAFSFGAAGPTKTPASAFGQPAKPASAFQSSACGRPDQPPSSAAFSFGGPATNDATSGSAPNPFLAGLSQAQTAGASSEPSAGSENVTAKVSGDRDSVWSYDANTRNSELPLALLPDAAALVLSSDPKDQLQGTLYIRKLLSVDDAAPLDDVIDAGVVPPFVEFLERRELPDLQMQAAWALTNIASGTSDHTQLVIDAGAIPPFTTLLSSPNMAIVEQAAWALGNIAGDSAEGRNATLESGALQPMLHVLSDSTASTTVLRNVAWAVANLFRGSPHTPLRYLSLAAPSLAIIAAHDDSEVAMDAMWAISYNMDATAPDPARQKLLANAIPAIVDRMAHLSNSALLTPALRCVIGFSAVVDTAEKLALSPSFFPCLGQVMTSGPGRTKRAAFEALATLFSHGTTFVQAADGAGMAPFVASNLVSGGAGSAELDVLGHFVAAAHPEHMTRWMIDAECLDALHRALKVPQKDTVLKALKIIRAVLEHGRHNEAFERPGSNPFQMRFMRKGGQDAVEELTAHDDAEVSDAATALLETFCPDH